MQRLETLNTNIPGTVMPNPKIKSKTKAANKKAKNLGFKGTFDCELKGSTEQKLAVQDAFSKTNPNGI